MVCFTKCLVGLTVLSALTDAASIGREKGGRKQNRKPNRNQNRKPNRNQPTTAPPAECFDVAAEIADWAEESTGPSGWGDDGKVWIDVSSTTDLEMFSDGGEQLFGVQFEPLPVPRGARIDHAVIELEPHPCTGPVPASCTPASYDSAGTPIEATITAELASSPGPFLDGTSGYRDDLHNVSDRVDTGRGTVNSASWTIGPPLSQGETVVHTTDLSSMVQELVDLEGWAPAANAATFVFARATGTGTGSNRWFVTRSTTLNVRYCVGSTPTPAPAPAPAPCNAPQPHLSFHWTDTEAEGAGADWDAMRRIQLAAGGADLEDQCALTGSVTMDLQTHGPASLDGVLPRLTDVGGMIYLKDMYDTATVGTGFAAVEAVGTDLELYYNALVTLDGALPALEAVGRDLNIYSHYQLTTLGNAFAALRTIAGSLDVDNNDGLVTFGAAFGSLKSVAGDLKINDNPDLITLGAAFASLECRGSFSCSGSPVCETAEAARLAGLPTCE